MTAVSFLHLLHSHVLAGQHLQGVSGQLAVRGQDFPGLACRNTAIRSQYPKLTESVLIEVRLQKQLVMWIYTTHKVSSGYLSKPPLSSGLASIACIPSI